MLIKYILIRLIPILLLVALGYSFFMPSRGERQFTRMEAALPTAQSYRVERTARTSDMIQYNLLEVSCPDHGHSLMKLLPATPESNVPRYPDDETVLIGTTSYRKTKDGWQASTVQQYRGTGNCAYRAPLINEGGLPQFKVIRALARIEKQDVEEVNGESCREWRVSFHQPNGSYSVFHYCINEDDNLPRRVRTDDDSLTITYTSWNKPIDIQPPQ